jgi:hypothetical protein
MPRDRRKAAEMPLSNDSEARQRQLANLRQNAATTHGASSEIVIRDARERYLIELAEAFPSATHPELVIQAGRLAKLEALAAYIDARGVIRHQRRGDVFPAAALEEKIAAAYERQAAVLLDRQRAAVNHPLALDQYLAMKDAKAAEADGD